MTARAGITLLPAGSVGPVASLEDGGHSLAIVQKDAYEGGHYIYIRFPDDFRKTFQVKKVTELAASISNILRARYGVKSLQFVKINEDMNVGDTIDIII